MAKNIEEPRSSRKTAKHIGLRFLRNENAVLVVVLIVLIATFSFITKGLTSSRTNMRNVLLQSSIRGIAAIGETFVLLTAGIDVSIGGIGLFSSLVGAGMMTERAFENIIGYPTSILFAVPIMLLVGLGWGVINGTLVSRVGVPPLIVTLGMWEITKGAAFRISHGAQITSLPERLSFFGSGTFAGVPVPVIIFAVVAGIAYFFLQHTAFGRSIYATGGNPVSAWLSGINIQKILFVVYVISGFLAGLAAVIFTGRVMSAAMSSLSGLELDAIASVCIGGISLAGGKGSAIGVVIGVLIIGVINNGMSVLGAGPDVQGIVKGVIIITAVAIDYMRRRRG